MYNQRNLFEKALQETMHNMEDVLVKNGFPEELLNPPPEFPVCLLSPNDKITVTRTDAGPVYRYSEGDKCFDIYHGVVGILDNLTPTTEYIVIPMMKAGWWKIKNCTRDHIYVSRRIKLTSDKLAMMLAYRLMHNMPNSNIASWAIAHNSEEVLRIYDSYTTNKVPENRLTSVLVDKLIVTRKFDVLEYLVNRVKRKSENSQLPSWIVDALNKRIDEIDCDQYRNFINELINDPICK